MNTKLNYIIGSPIAQSKSPALHNSLYRDLGLESQFYFEAKLVLGNELEREINNFRNSNSNALTVTIPHKVEIIKYLDEIDSKAQQIGSVNTVIRRGEKLIGYNTDWLGTLLPLANEFGIKSLDISKVPNFLENQTVAVIGAGGVSRAIVFAVLKAGGSVKIFNRTFEKGLELEAFFEKLFPSRVQAFEFSNISQVKECQIIINATSVGMIPNVTQSPLHREFLNSDQIIFDSVYNPKQTQLLNDAAEKNCRTIGGLEMFLYQAKYQFELQTNRTVEIEKVRKAFDALTI